ncbi:MAG TPA: [protein-PII] uridylyltransferase [Candidatus Acidoferrales bacterium]|nr:[protein-PII] uridylyltransferase [Candidatus Acidoferrales bacterium]
MSFSRSDLLPKDVYPAETARIRQEFESSGDGRAAVLERSALVDTLVAQLYREWICADLGGPENFCLVALGGYGRRALFPHSDVDLLFLSANSRIEDSQKGAVAGTSRALWDLPVRLSPAARTLEECDALDRDNLEFSISLLDCRYLAGDTRLFGRLREQRIPQLVARERPEMVRNLAELTRRRHAKHGHTIFELEPNLKEGPGGLRDYQLAGWLALLAELEKNGRWITPEGLWPAALAEECGRAFDFLAAARCFLHFRQNRDFNQLTYELQAEAAAQGIGYRPGEALPAEDWMRSYFRHARSVLRLATQLSEEAIAAQPSLYGAFLDWRSRLSNADFTVARGRIFPRQPAALREPGGLLDLFEFMARHGLALSAEAERLVEQALVPQGGAAPSRDVQWPHLRQILVLPHAAEALRAMHRLSALVHFFPEFHAIDSLVVRDFYHRYTVDEHSFLTIQNLHCLRSPQDEWERRFGEIFTELEQPELLFFALLFHDVGKGTPAPEHIEGSLEAAEAIVSRLGIEPADRETIQFLIANHLLMSATLLRRDIFEPGTVHSFAETVGTLERLKMLCLFTYADIKAVSPEALTPWKAEMLWQLYVATSNFLTHYLDDDRFHVAETEPAQLERIRAFLSDTVTGQKLSAFLEGFPQRYLLTHLPEEVAAHYQMASRLEKGSVQSRLRARPHDYELTVLTADRPRLFASLTGVLAAWGMNILKAEAFANQAGVVLDTFRFVDPFRTLRLNPSEVERFEKSLRDVLAGRTSLEALMSGRLSPGGLPTAKVKVVTQIRVDDHCSAHSTLLELIAQDRPGLLYQVSSTLAELGCNIEVALIDTEGQRAIDVFYLTCQGAKLTPAQQQALREALLRTL